MNKQQLLKELHELLKKENTGMFYEFAVTKLIHDLKEHELSVDEAIDQAKNLSTSNL